ncbi:MAG: acyltransferase [Proteobacteria bacterium]|nr:acyltransferase [Pseudomonadota bacterium]
MKSLNVKYIPELDHIRFFAAIIIMIFHVANGSLVHLLHFDIGVSLFFTLSGFLFFLIAANNDNEIAYWKFIYNRFLRIYPLVIFLFFIAITIMGSVTTIDFINLFGLNLPGKERTDWFVGDWGYQSLSFNWWTIGVEFVFYLTFPFLFKFYKKQGISYLISVALLIVLFKHGFYYALLEEHGWKKLSICLNYSVFGNFDIFIVGMIAGHFVHQKQDFFSFNFVKSKLFFMTYLVLMWFFLINYIDKFDAPLSPVITSILCALLVIFYITSFSNTRDTYFSRALSLLGSMSFSIYLLHSFIKDALVGLGISGQVENFCINYFSAENTMFFLALLLYIPATLVISYFTFKIIEQPFLNMRVSYFKKSQIDLDVNPQGDLSVERAEVVSTERLLENN